MSNESTKEQLRRFLEAAVERVKNPTIEDKRKMLKQDRLKKSQVRLKYYGY